MITVTYNGQSYQCSTAFKGTNFIHLVDADGEKIAFFDGVSDFSGFTISGGSWTTPPAPDDCYIITMGEDGVLRKGSHKCSDISKPKIGTITTTTSWTGSASPYTQTVTVTGATVTVNSKVDIQGNSTVLEQMLYDRCNALYVGNNNGILTLYAVGGAPTVPLTIQATITEVTQ